jgi:nucleoside-diphosphate-sugar epimerase
MDNNDLHVVLGTGPLGRAVMEALAARGRRVRMVNRSGALKPAPAGVEVVAGNVYDAGNVRELTRGAAVVYQCAQPEYHEWQEKFAPLQAAVIDGVAGHRNGAAPRLVIAENLYMYGDPNGQPMHEDMPHAAHTRKGRVRAQMAEAALAAHRAGKVRIAIGRASDFFGPHVLNSAMGERVFYPALAGKAAQLAGQLDLPHTQTYIGDFGQALALLGERDEAFGQAWHVPNDQPRITQREFITLVAEAIGQPVKPMAAGRLMMSFVGLFNPGARETVEMLYEFEKPHIVDSSRFERAFGMRATPLREAIGTTVAWFRSNPPAH